MIKKIMNRRTARPERYWWEECQIISTRTFYIPIEAPIYPHCLLVLKCLCQIFDEPNFLPSNLSAKWQKDIEKVLSIEIQTNINQRPTNVQQKSTTTKIYVLYCICIMNSFKFLTILITTFLNYHIYLLLHNINNFMINQYGYLLYLTFVFIFSNLDFIIIIADVRNDKKIFKYVMSFT